MNVQLIEKNGVPEFAVIPYTEYQSILSELKGSRDLSDALKISSAIDQGEETFPSAFVEKLIGAKSRLREWRKYRELTQVQLAKITELSQGAIASIELGKRVPNLDTGRKLADALNCDIDDLF